jgi:tetratricopeptide (TPR) repeat protein
VLLDSLPKAQEVLQALEAGTPLALLARKHSTDPAARQSYGYLGRVKPQALEAPLREALRGLAPGRHTGIVELPEGRFAIAQIIDMRDYQEAEKAFREENFDLAERHLLRHLQNNPDASRSRLMLGKIQELKGRLTQAEATYKEAIRYHPELAEAYAMLGRLYLKMGLYEQAKEVFEEGLRYSDSPLLEEGLELAHILMLQTQGAMP